jgi:hypothetical protein
MLSVWTLNRWGHCSEGTNHLLYSRMPVAFPVSAHLSAHPFHDTSTSRIWRWMSYALLFLHINHCNDQSTEQWTVLLGWWLFLVFDPSFPSERSYSLFSRSLSKKTSVVLAGGLTTWYGEGTPRSCCVICGCESEACTSCDWGKSLFLPLFKSWICSLY